MNAYPIPPDVELESPATEWSGVKENSGFSSFPYSAEVSFDFPLPSEALILFSHGALSSGHLKITTSSASTSLARVQVTVQYHNTAVRDTAKVCVIKRKNGEGGVGIFTLKNWPTHTNTDRLRFEVQLVLPRSSSPSALYINNLTTDVHNFSQDVDALKDVINFGDIHLKGSNGKITVKSMVALNAALGSSNGPISGNYTVSDWLNLRTSNGPVKVNVGMIASDSNAVKSLTMRTSNSLLESIVNLSTSSGFGGVFRIKADTSNGRLATQITSCPVNSVLSLDAKTSNSAASVTLPSTYEGGFVLNTSNAEVWVNRVGDNVRDPSGRGRLLGVEVNKSNEGKAAGKVYWDRNNGDRGDVTVRSSNGPVSLYV
ncbi:hypothetical protein C8R43DRAFT_875013 [Mycena crocata]|nr:hypothetical protein C8R43DRAFT_875013 [Mycena crocata]